MSEFNIALYIRLSNADEETGKKRDESNSVVHQRMLLNGFLDKHDELKSCRRFEYVDDGYTGTNTDRPSFQRMIADIRAGKVNLVCVKDFSRFSRDYIEIGDYLECLFPFLGVRFISVNDGYDSFDYKGTTGGLDVVMRNIVYAAYSKDLSVKVRTARDQRMKKGQMVFCNPPLGYKRDPNDMHNFLIDPEGAEIIRMVFDLACGGNNPSEIAKILNEKGVLSPAEYHDKIRPDSKQHFKRIGAGWSYSSVRCIIQRYTYTGALVGNRTSVVAPCSRKRRVQPVEKQIIVENHHAAIISKETFDKAQTAMRKNNQGEKKTLDYPLKGLIRCGCCGRIMKRRIKGYGYDCRFKNAVPAGSKCTEVGFENEERLENIVFDAIQMYISALEADNMNAKDVRDKWSAGIQTLMNQLEGLQKHEEHIKADKLRQYEEYAAGILDKEMYLLNKSSADKQLAAICEETSVIEKQLREMEQGFQSECSNILETARRFHGQKKLTNEMALAFVEAVYIYVDDEVKIKWRFQDAIK